MKFFFLFFVGATFFSCAERPKQPNVETEMCTNCGMKLSDDLFICQSNIEKKLLFFDSIECMAAYTFKKSLVLDGDKTWVSHFGAEKGWIPLHTAFYAHSERMKSPMGMGLFAFRDSISSQQFILNYTGKSFKWTEVVQFVGNKWFQNN